jgi:hypothetical protein
MKDKYVPTMNPNTEDIIYFNFRHSKEDFNVFNIFNDKNHKKKEYIAFDHTMTKIIAQRNYYNSIAKKVGFSNVSVRNNMDWHLGTNMVIKGKPIEDYLRQTGKPLRTIPLARQLSSKNK